MAFSYFERQVESAINDLIGAKATRIMSGINWLASKQGGLTTIENYQLLGKRALIVVGVAAVAVQGIAYVVARKSEEQRIERVVRRVLAEERQNEEEKSGREE